MGPGVADPFLSRLAGGLLHPSFSLIGKLRVNNWSLPLGRTVFVL